ncbi:Glutamate receptor, ionotropic kainate 2, partial [Stegodyphus mimosarum]
MELFGYSVILLLSTVLCWGLPGRINIGGVFEFDDAESEAVFRVAIDRLNRDESLLKTSRIITMVERIYSDDSFKASEICCGLLGKGVAAVFGRLPELVSMHMQSICDSLEVPFIDSRWDYWLKRDHLSINLYPHPNVLSSAFIHLINIWGWRDFFLVYEEDEAIVRMKEFLIEGEKALKEHLDVETEKSENKDPKWKIRMYQFNRTSSFRDTFWQIKRAVKLNKKLNYHIVLDVSRKNLYTALKAAQQVGMMTEDQKYLIVSLDLHTIDMEDFQHTKANITSFRLVQDEMPDFQNIMLEVNHRLSQRSHEPLKTLKTEAALIYDSVLLLSDALEQMNQAKNITSIPPVSCNSMNKGIDGTSLINFMK